MPMTPRERKRRFRAQAALDELTLEEAAKKKLGVSGFHLGECMAGRRIASDELKQRFADYIGKAFEEVWGNRSTSEVQVA